MVALLDANLSHYASLTIDIWAYKVDITPGAGAAGSMGAALSAFCGATLRSGIDIVMEVVGLDAAVKDADLVITESGSVNML